MIRVRTEKEYLVKIVNYKGNILKIEKPKDRKGFYKLAIQVCRIYERAKEGGFLTRELLDALKQLADLILHRTEILHLLISNPSLVRNLKKICVEKIDKDIEEEIIEGKIREHDRKRCHVCGCSLVYPAYVVRKKGGKIEKVSKAIGIKCLNSLRHKIEDIVKDIKVMHDEIKNFVEKNKNFVRENRSENFVGENRSVKPEDEAKKSQSENRESEMKDKESEKERVIFVEKKEIVNKSENFEKSQNEALIVDIANQNKVLNTKVANDKCFPFLPQLSKKGQLRLFT